MQVEYRADIDGLRAIAVLAVLGFHAFPEYLPAGFIGVDIFFVISGFLISRLIYNDLDKGTFSLAGFYARRIKRIFPALIVVLLACIAVGSAVLFPDEYLALGKHVAGGATFVSNFLLLSEAGYFDEASERKPLLHLWSLGIEEQFYLLWPILILLFARWKKDPFWVAATIFLASFAANVVVSTISPNAAFYLPVTRFWELMIGCMLAGIAYRQKDYDGRSLGAVSNAYIQYANSNSVKQVALWIGVTLVTFALVSISRERPFPSWWALLPTVGTALLIWAGPASTIVCNVLTNRALVYVGLISYPLYLWHWPLLSFGRILRLKEPTILLKIGILAAAFALAALTYRFIERPIRFGRPLRLKPVAALIVALASMGTIGLVLYVSDGLPTRYSHDVQSAIRAPTYSPHLQCENGALATKDELGVVCSSGAGSNEQKIVIWGNSHAGVLASGLEDARRRSENFSLATFAYPACPPVLSFSSTHQPGCSAFNERVIESVTTWKPQTVIMAGRWEFYSGSGWGILSDASLRATISRLKTIGVDRVVVMGQFPVWYWGIAPWIVRARLLRTQPVQMVTATHKLSLPTRDNTYLRPTTYQTDNRIREAVRETEATFVSPLPTLCNSDGCLLVIPDQPERLMAQDGDGHLTTEGAIYFVTANTKMLLNR